MKRLAIAVLVVVALGCASEAIDCPGGQVDGTVRELVDALNAGRTTAGRVVAPGVEERAADVCLPQLRHAWKAFGPEWKSVDAQLREQGLRYAPCGAGACIEEAPAEDR